MTNKSYQRELEVQASPQEVYAALTVGIGDWWAAPDKVIENVNNTVTFKFSPNPTYWTMRIEKLVPNKTVKFKCVDAKHIHEGLPDSILEEWLDTQLEWEITPKGDRTLIRFEHKGLIPTLGCYEICEEGWDHFFMGSLKRYLETTTEPQST